MSQIESFKNQLKIYHERQVKAFEGISTDVQNLAQKIVDLQKTQGQLNEEDQKMLDEIERDALSLTERLEGLDLQTPPDLTNPAPTEDPTPTEDPKEEAVEEFEDSKEDPLK